LDSLDCLAGAVHALGCLLEVNEGSESGCDSINEDIKFLGCVCTKVNQHSIALGFPVNLDG
jgi:hypothetical protein